MRVVMNGEEFGFYGLGFLCLGFVVVVFYDLFWWSWWFDFVRLYLVCQFGDVLGEGVDQ